MGKAPYAEEKRDILVQCLPLTCFVVLRKSFPNCQFSSGQETPLARNKA